MLSRAIAVIALAGCFKPDPPGGLPCGTDLECPQSQLCVAGICGGTAVELDAPIDAPTGCWAAWLSGAPTFDAPVPIGVAESAGSESNSDLSVDQLTLYFERAGDIFFTHRADLDSPWGPASKVPEFSTTDNEGKVVTAAGDSIAILSFATGAGSTAFDLFQLERPAPGQPYANPSTAHFAQVNSAVADFDPDVTPDGLHLYFSPGGNTLKVASRSSPTADFDAPVAVPGIVGIAADPTISPDQRVLVYSTEGPTSLDLAFATRSDSTGAFGSATLLSIDSPQDDGDPELSADGCTLIYSSARTGSVGGRDLWQVKVK